MDGYPLQRAPVPTKSYRSQRISKYFTSHCWWEREFFIDNLLVRIHFIIVMIRWTGLAP